MSIIASGDWWKFEDDGTLYVYCTGDMPYDAPFTPWYDYRADVQSVVIQDSVTNIGDNAFIECGNLTSVTIGSGVVSIGESAFENCFTLSGVTIPDVVVSIGDRAFASCESLTNIAIPNSVTSIGDTAFVSCTALTSATIPSSVTSIGSGAFAGCESLTSVTIPDPDSANYSWYDVFQDSENSIVSLTIADGVTSIGDDAFSGCYFADNATVTIPNSVTSIGDGAFRQCESLTSATIPNSVTSIGDGAFDYCDALTDIYYGGTEAQWNAITIGTDNDPLHNATKHYAGEPEPGTKTLISIAVTTPPTKTAYTAGETFDPSGMVVTATYSDGSAAAVTGYDYKETPLTISDTSIGIGYFENGVYAETAVTITVTEPEAEPVPAQGQIQIRVLKNNGDTLTFSGHAAKQVEYVQSTSFDGNDVQVDEISAIIRQTDPDWLSNWNGVNMKSPVLLTYNSRTEKYYHKIIRRVGKYDFELTAQSPLGRLTDDFPGDLYSAASLSDVIKAVIGDAIPKSAYSINPALDKVKVYGWLPYQERRTSIHQLALAYGFIIRRDENNNLYFTVPDTGDPYEIPSNAIFTGGSVDYSVGRTYYRADITAYEYLKRETEPQILYEGGTFAENFTVRFDTPMFDLQADNLTISGSGVNYAVVSGSGQLTGKPYTQISSTISIDGDRAADPQHILSVSGVYVITSLNAASVGERLIAYHNAPAVVNMDILRTTQRSGDYVTFVDPFGDAQRGYITALSGSITSIDRATASIVCEYAPSWDSDYDAVEVLTKDTPNPWVVPDYLDGKRIRVVLIGGGTGGEDGEDGTESEGGRGGAPGAGGKIWDSEKAILEKLVVNKKDTYLYSCGTGGARGDPGTASTFGNASLGVDFSSEYGSSSNSGFYDGIEGNLYALPGTYRGVDGGAATTGTENGDRTNPGYNNVQRHTVTLPWDSSRSWTSGTPGDGDAKRSAGGDGYIYDWAYGGLGGGAAVGGSYDGSSGRCDAYSADGYSARGGDGGNGADAGSIFPDITYGCGGNGGHGGGAGGAGGKAYSEATGGNSPDPTQDGSHGRGGSGSSGQKGGDGCILIYYNSPDT